MLLAGLMIMYKLTKGQVVSNWNYGDLFPTGCWRKRIAIISLSDSKFVAVLAVWDFLSEIAFLFSVKINFKKLLIGQSKSINVGDKVQRSKGSTLWINYVKPGMSNWRPAGRMRPHCLFNARPGVTYFDLYNCEL